MKGLVAFVCALTLACGAASVEAAAVTPVEGNWNATSSAGLPVSFEVTQGQVVNARFKFRWGFCGTFESALKQSTAIEPDGHWKYQDSRGPYMEGTFLAPDRVEGRVVAPSRMLPGCPETEASFVAAPGPPIVQPDVLVTDNIVSGHLAKRPHKIVLSADGSFYAYAIRWASFGEPTAHALGRAYTRTGCSSCPDREVERPRVKIRLTKLTPQGDDLVYGRLQYELRGPLPRHTPRHGSLPLL